MRDFFERVTDLRREGRSFAMATVVGRRGPVSAHRGDHAIVHADGRMEGFVGGACLREIVRKQALETLRTGETRLLSVQPDADAGAGDARRLIVPMTCVSEGAVDVYIEPCLRPRRVVVVGATPVAEALARTAATLDYDVVRVVADDERRDVEMQAAAGRFAVAGLDALGDVVSAGGPGTAAVVVTQGHYDEPALEAILRAGVAAYVGLVASRKRGATVKQWLEERGIAGAGEVRSPAGLDLGARTPPEVALSILAEIVQSRPDRALDTGVAVQGQAALAEAAAPAVAIDPVCHMEVEMAAARHTAEIDETTYYFCCPHCRAAFLREPARYLAPAHD
jgi:xanthine dehydrogenase accessory factor